MLPGQIGKSYSGAGPQYQAGPPIVLAYRGLKCFRHRPTQNCNSTKDRSRVHAEFIGPLDQRAGRSFVRGHHSVSSVPGLGCSVGPPHISPGVPSVVVDPIHAQPGCREVLIIRDKAPDIVPATAYTDATPTISRVCGVGGLVAPAHHRKPNGEETVLAQTVGAISHRGLFSRQTATRFSPPRFQRTACMHGCFPAIAPAQVVCVVAVSARSRR